MKCFSAAAGAVTPSYSDPAEGNYRGRGRGRGYGRGQGRGAGRGYGRPSEHSGEGSSDQGLLYHEHSPKLPRYLT